MKKHSILLFILTLLTLSGFGQRKLQQLDDEEAKKQEQLKAYEKKDKKFDIDKLVYGGNVGISFSGGGSYILAQPMVGYKIYPKTILGSGFTYIYQSITFNNVKYSTSAYGPILFARQNLFGQIFGHFEYQPINYERTSSVTLKSERIWSNQLFVGGGLGGNGIQVYVLYNLLYDNNSFYSTSPWYIRVGFMF
jgi:hypothetical protein